MKTEIIESKSLREIWDIKEKIFQETKDLSPVEYGKYIDSNTSELKKRFKNKIRKYQLV